MIAQHTCRTPPEDTELDTIAASIRVDELPESFPDSVDVEQWLDSRAGMVASLANESELDCPLVRRLWYETQAMLIAMQVRHLRYEPDFSDVIGPLRRLIMSTEDLGSSVSPNPALVSSEMSRQFLSIIRGLYRELRIQKHEGSKEIPQWCVLNRGTVPARRANRGVWSLEDGELAEPLRRLRFKLANARARNLGSVACKRDEYEVALILSGTANSPLPDESIVSLPEWFRACRENAKHDDRLIRIMKSLQEAGAG